MPDVPTTQTLMERLGRIFNDMTQLKIVTVVGQVNVTVAENNERSRTTVDTTGVKDLKGMVTIIDLLDGDITNIIDPSVETSDTLRSFHATQVEKSQAIIASNVSAVIELAKAIKSNLAT
jgi:hypothetical protein